MNRIKNQTSTLIVLNYPVYPVYPVKLRVFIYVNLRFHSLSRQ
jgi:hypothetical protein